MRPAAGRLARKQRAARRPTAAALFLALSAGTLFLSPPACFASAAGVSSSTPTDPTGPAGSEGASSGADGVPRVVDRPMPDQRISEGSGLAASPTHSGIVWTHNDSGNTGQLFAVGPSGKVVATLTVAGAQGYDWEAVATYRDAQGRSMLAVGDIGDNEAIRSRISVLLVPEPSRLVSRTVTPQRVLRLTYPQGAADAETLLVDPQGRWMHVVTKGLFQSEAFVVPPEVFGSRASGRTDSGTLLKVADTFLSLVTDGDVLPDGRVLLRTYGVLALLPSPGTSPVEEWKATTKVNLPDQPQGEGLTVLDGGTAVLISSEGAGEPLLRVDLPSQMRESATAGNNGNPTAAAPGSAERSAEHRTEGTGGPADRWGDLPGAVRLGVLAAGLLVAFLLVNPLLKRGSGRRDPGRGKAGGSRRRA
ncbi:MAG: hypothetical protein QG608_2959 [Actinomycetota bacterium]|nr:hypothetical protein [Actinomycetota bacterium]